MASKTTQKEETIDIMQVTRDVAEFYILGTSPLIMNCMAAKAKQELILPKGKKTSADKAQNLKHDPMAEFRASPYKIIDPASPTLLGILPVGFKKGMGVAALDTPGAKKAQILRLIYVQHNLVPVFGVPQIFSSIVRSADINKTPDVRTRAILPEWACKLSIEYPTPILRQQSIINLLAAAGFQSGIGDWRQEKGSGSYGAYKIVEASNKEWHRIVKTQGRDAQIAALENPICYDDATSELLGWFDVELKRRGFKVAA